MSRARPKRDRPGRLRLPAEQEALRRLRHEVRTPLSAVSGFCELIEDELRPVASADFIAGLRQIQCVSQRNLDISNELFADGSPAIRRLDFAALHALCRAPVAEVSDQCDRLVAEAGAAGWQTTVEDLRRIQADTRRWLMCVEEIIARHWR